MRAKRAWAEPHSWVNLPIPENLVITWLYTTRPPARLSVRPSAPQGNQCSISHFLVSLGAQENWYCTHIAHQYCDQLTAVKTGCRPIEFEYFFEVIRWQVTCFKMVAGSSVIFFLIHMKYVVFMHHTIKVLISNWPRTQKFSQLLQAGKTVAFDFSLHGHALVMLYVQFLCSDWSKFDRWAHVENLCSTLKLVYFDSWSWQSFVSTCDVFNCLFPLNVQNEIQLLSRVLCYSWLVCLLGFWLRNTSLVKVKNPISDGIVFVFHLAWCVQRGLKSLKRFWPYLRGFQELHLEW